MKTIIILDERLDTAAQFLLLEALAFCLESKVWVDASRVRFLGARCLELLFSARKSVEANGGNLFLSAFSEEFEETLATFGVSVADLQVGGA